MMMTTMMMIKMMTTTLKKIPQEKKSITDNIHHLGINAAAWERRILLEEMTVVLTAWPRGKEAFYFRFGNLLLLNTLI